MARELYDGEGNPISVPDEAELKAAEDARTKLAAYETEKAAWEAEKKDLTEQANPNWKAAREREKIWMEKEKKYQEDLEKAGFKIEAPAVDLEAVRQEATKAAREEMLNSRKNRLLSQYDEQTRPVVEKYLGKLTSGETVTTENIDDFVAEAEILARPTRNSNPIKRALGSGHGEPPRFDKPKYQETQGGTELANKLGIDTK